MPTLATAPPRIAVRRSPKESMRIPARGEMKNVIPMESDPTKAKHRLQPRQIDRPWVIDNCTYWGPTGLDGSVVDVQLLQLVFQLQVDEPVAVVNAED